MVDSRAKGAGFERQVADLIWQHLGVTVRRDLDQYRQSNLGDLLGLDGWVIECKRYRDQNSFLHRPEWWTQVCHATGANAHPVLIYKYDRKPIRCVFPLHVINPSYAHKLDAVCTTDFETWCYVVRETAPH